MSRNFRIVTGIVSTFLALFLAWKIGLWLEPEPQTAQPVSADQGALFFAGKVRDVLPYELREVKMSPDGKEAQGTAVVRFDYPRAELRPLAVTAIGALRQKAPAVERGTLAVKPHAGCSGCGIAQIAWGGGKVRIAYGTPSLEQIAASNALIGTTAEDRPRLYAVDSETFASGITLLLAIDAARRKEPGAGEEQLLEKGAAAAGIPYATARRMRDFMRWYYTGNRYGGEEFLLPPR